MRVRLESREINSRSHLSHESKLDDFEAVILSQPSPPHYKLGLFIYQFIIYNLHPLQLNKLDSLLYQTKKLKVNRKFNSGKTKDLTLVCNT